MPALRGAASGYNAPSLPYLAVLGPFPFRSVLHNPYYSIPRPWGESSPLVGSRKIAVSLMFMRWLKIPGAKGEVRFLGVAGRSLPAGNSWRTVNVSRRHDSGMTTSSNPMGRQRKMHVGGAHGASVVSYPAPDSGSGCRVTVQIVGTLTFKTP